MWSQSYKYSAGIAGIIAAGYSQNGASQSFSLQRANGMTQISLAAYSQFTNTNLVTVAVTAQSPAAGSVSRPPSVTNAISSLGLNNLAGIVDGSLVSSSCSTLGTVRLGSCELERRWPT